MINALNRDLPYDQFIIEQIAGDLLPNATQDQIVATGFLRNSMINEEGGIDPEQFRMEAMFDRMDAIGKGMLGVTIQCAQCHNHKYDPLTQEEYYRMFAFLNNTHESNIAVYTPDAADEARGDLPAHRGDRRPSCSAAHPDWQTRMAAWESTVRSEPAGVDACCDPTVDDISTGGETLTADEGWLACWRRATRPPSTRVKFTVKTDLPRDHGLAAGTAHRSESAARRAGPVDQGHGRADGVRSGSRPADAGQVQSQS